MNQIQYDHGSIVMPQAWMNCSISVWIRERPDLMPQKRSKSMPGNITFQASLVECGDTITTGRLSQIFPFRTKTSDTAKNTNAVKLTRSLAMIKLSLLRVNIIMMVQRPHIYICVFFKLQQPIQLFNKHYQQCPGTSLNNCIRASDARRNIPAQP